MATSVGRVELFCNAGDDIVITAQLDVQLITDADDAGLATQQFLQRVLTSAPVLTDQQGNIFAPPSDYFNPLWGVALQRQVGQMGTEQLSARNAATIRDQISAADGIASIDELDVGDVTTNGFFPVSVSVTTTAGQSVSVPSQPVQSV